MTARPALNMPLIDLAADRLRLYRQIGVEEVSLPGGGSHSEQLTVDKPVRPLVPPAQTGRAGPAVAWELPALQRMADRCAAFGLRATVVDLKLSGSILLGTAEREADIALVCANIAAAGAAGLKVLTWNFTALRASEGYGAIAGGGRGGADLRDFDARRLSEAPLPDVPACTHHEMWARLAWVLGHIVPAAEAAGVKLALHPTDPPVKSYRGVAQIGTSFAEIRCADFASVHIACIRSSWFILNGLSRVWGTCMVNW